MDTEAYRSILKAVQASSEPSTSPESREKCLAKPRRLLEQTSFASHARQASACAKALPLLRSLESRVEHLRSAFVAEELTRKEERQRAKKARDYEIFSEMPYKLSSRKFELGERHPVSKKRFEAAKETLEETSG